MDDNLLESIRAIVREEVQSALGHEPRLPRTGETGEPGPVLSGDVRYFRLPEVLQLVSMQRMTGRLSMSHEHQMVDIYFKGGQVVFATGDKRGRREQLGFMLINMGRITKSGLDMALDKSANTGVRLGKVLVDEGLVSLADIKSVILKQTERSAYKAMAWDEGSFFFEFCDMPEFVEDMPVSLSVENLILEGVRRIEEGRLISEKIPSLDIVFIKPAYTAEEITNMGLRGEERLVLDLIDGKSEVKDLFGRSGLGEFGLLRALYALYSAGIIRKREHALRSDRTQYL